MLNTLKKRLYFFVARYFRFWAKIKLRRWGPKVIVVTGSAGKTTLLHMIEAQLGSEAHYSHHANSSFGIPFDILGLSTNIQSRAEWLGLFILAPLALVKRPHPQSLYVVEVDADRPREASFLAKLLRPDITLWVSALHSHTQQYDKVVRPGRFASAEEAVAYEYGNMAAATSDLVILDGDNPLMQTQRKRISADIKSVQMKQLKNYILAVNQTKFTFSGVTYELPALLPKSNFYQVGMAHQLMTYLQKTPDYDYTKFKMPPGRSNILRGILRTTLFDSTYNNSNLESLKSVLQLFEDYPVSHKWAVVGDMLEQGEDEAAEHAKIADELAGMHVEQIILIGPRTAEYTAPLLRELLPESVKLTVFTEPVEVLKYLQANLKGGETVLFKGVRYLEGVIEPLLADKTDADKLVRRGAMWDKKRALWGLK